ncbi:TonB-dependent receptor [Caulobacter mirabilis]|uniref:TonB-dependent siderophore receptor n=1 Tax=Caulobacter mirabilis TaxID=69666 RepID=A0A2D2ASV9_9CAUL|nr:TonB-dependent siderophore receptor [Caulobacter mirabilis]ATQ41089.1 TonB-dependent siderophore receptor [Caulobacter mirabilis]
MRSNTRAGVTARAKRALSVAAVAGAAGLSLAPALALAADATAADADQPTDVSGVDIVGAKGHAPSSPKLTATPLDTPQTITVVSDRTVRDQNLMTLRDILTTVPGITFGAGEGGGGYGDSINLRGYSANNDITTDGLRDSAQYTRSDPFNLQQIEVVNGANSVYSGAGSLGGSINLVSKLPHARDTALITGGLGTDGYGRLTVDANKVVADGIAVRLNAMKHKNDVPGRDVETYDRWGIAPSVTFGVGGPIEATLSYFHQEDDNTPEYGVPYGSNIIVNGPLPGVDRSTYFGYRNMDRQKTQVDSLTGRVRWTFNDNITLSNISRWQKVTQDLLVNPPQGTWCLNNGFSAQPSTTFQPVACTPAGSYTLSGPRGNIRDTENQQWVSQTDVNLKFDTFGWKHNMVVGFSISHETYDLTTGNIQRTTAGVAPAYPQMTLRNPVNVYTGPRNFFLSAISEGELNNQALYVFDTVELNDQWQLNGGLRYEKNDGEFINTPYTVVGGVATPGVTTRAKSDENLFSFRLGVVYKPVENASLYLAYGNTETPSQGTVNGGCSVTTNPNCDVDPEEGEVIELGAKWDVFDSRLSLTGAIFQNERSKFRVNDLTTNLPQQLDGKSRVRGLTLGAAGQINERWTVIANYTYLDSEILQNVVDGVLDAQKGDPLPNTPKHAFNLWTSYMITDKIMVGYGATFSGEYAFQRPTGSTALYHAPSYWVHNAAVTWTATDNISLQLNIKNLTDEEYYTRIRSANGFGWATPGDARSAQVTLNYRF